MTLGRVLGLMRDFGLPASRASHGKILVLLRCIVWSLQEFCGFAPRLHGRVKLSWPYFRPVAF